MAATASATGRVTGAVTTTTTTTTRAGIAELEREVGVDVVDTAELVKAAEVDVV